MLRASFFDSRRSLGALLLPPFLLLAVACGQDGTTPTTTGAGGDSGGTTTGATTSGSGGSGGDGGSAPLTPVPLSIVEWNTHNFFDSIVNPATPSETVLSAADYASKRKTIGAALKGLDGDIVVLTEIENKAILDDLNKSELGGAYSQTILIEGNDSRGIDVGVLSKITADSVVSHKDEYFTLKGTNGPQYRFARDCLEVHFTVNQRELILLGVHFRAKSAPDDPDKRLAEAQHARQIADDLHTKRPGAGILILGDFNDTPDSPPYVAVVGAAPDLFVDSADVVPIGERYSYDYQGKLELIDHQMANPRLAAMLDPTHVVLLHGSKIDDGSKFASDHSPFKATYQVR
jgi:endonuclease/exonuclease/phosphatase family metal-dependent hydrolase